jgi:hypothetical protein
MLKEALKSARINSIRRAAVSTAQRAKGIRFGNLIINDKWFSAQEWRNFLLGQEWPESMSVSSFIGATITYQELEITQEELDANGGVVEHVINGRTIQYKKPGQYNVNLSIDLSTVEVSEKEANLMKLRILNTELNTVSRASQAAPAAPAAPTTQRPATMPAETLIDDAPANTEQIINEETQLPAGQPVVTEVEPPLQ